MAPVIDPKRLGPPLNLTPEELDQAAIVTPVDIVVARMLWLHHAPQNMADLLDAGPEDS